MYTRTNRRSQLVPVVGLIFFLAGLSAASANPSGPSTLRMSPDGKRLYVLTTDGFFHVFDTATNRSLASFRVAARGFHTLTPGLAVSPDGSRIYIARPAAEGDPIARNGTLLVIESTTNRPLATIEVGAWPRTVAVSSDGHRVYVTNLSITRDSGSISVVDAETLRLLSDLRVGGYPGGLAVSPDGASLYVSRTHSSYWFPSRRTPTAAMIDAAGLRVVNTVPLNPDMGNDPLQVIPSPDGRRIYLLHSAGRLTILDATTLQVVGGGARLFGFPMGVAISPDGKRLYIADPLSDAVMVLDTESLTVRMIGGSSKPALFAGSPTGVALSPDGSRLYVSLRTTRLVRVLDTATDEVVATLPVEDPSLPTPQN
jgi:YVTN family beta-propeller protein